MISDALEKIPTTTSKATALLSSASGWASGTDAGRSGSMVRPRARSAPAHRAASSQNGAVHPRREINHPVAGAPTRRDPAQVSSRTPR